jgi:polyhydroxyalkanoate synthesis regulator phasin
MGKERTMDQAERKENFGTWLRRAWNAAIRTAEAMERSPVEELFDRVDRLEWEVAALKKEGAAGIHAAIGEIADAERA